MICIFSPSLKSFLFYFTAQKSKSTDIENTDLKTPKSIALEWLKLHGIMDVNDVLGVLCESDIGLRTAEDFSRQVKYVSYVCVMC